MEQRSGFRRVKVDNEIESKILTGLIISDKLCRDVFPLYKPYLIQVDYARTIINWIMDYYARYQKAPKSDIQDIFNSRRSTIDETEAKLIASYLASLSKQFEESNEGYNADYYFDETEKYFRKRSVEILRDNLSGLLIDGEIGKAEQQVAEYKKIAKSLSNWTNPLNSFVIRNAMMDNEDYLFSLPGKVGDLIGPFKRGWLVSIMGSMKRGKCIVKGSKVFMADGTLKNIEDVVRDKDYEIYTFSEESGKIIKGRIVHHWENGLKPSFEVTTRSGRQVKTTGNHPFLTVQGWKPLEELSEEDFIAVPKQYLKIEGASYPKYKIKLLAYLLAEGNLEGLSFTNVDSKIQKDFLNCVQYMKDDVNWKYGDITGYIVKKESSDRKRHGPEKTNTRKWLNSIGVGRELSKHKQIPDIVFSWNIESVRLFLSILFSCDGSIYPSKGNRTEIQYGSASKRLIYQINHLLLRFGIVGKIDKSLTKINNKVFESWHVSIRDKQSVLSFIYHIGFFSKKQKKSEKLKVKLEKVKSGRSFLTNFPSCFTKFIVKPKISDYVKNTGTKNREWYQQFGIGNVSQSLHMGTSLTPETVLTIANQIESEELKKFVNSDMFFDKIVSIKDIGMQETYDLAVEGTHNFIADDVIVHNTWFLLEFAIQALLNYCKVAFISLEMDWKSIAARIYKRVLAQSDISSMFIYPAFDCLKNQLGTCRLPNRENQFKLIETPEDELPEFTTANPYRLCNACRDTSVVIRKGLFIPAIWYETQNRVKLASKNIISSSEGLRKMYGDNLRILSYPSYSANVTDIKRDLDRLEYVDDFVPDVVIVDYADILRPEDARLTGRDRIAETWMMLKQLSQTRYCLGVTASQTTRDAIDKKNLSQKDTPEDIRKNAIADVMIPLNQTPREKRMGYLRMGLLFHRHREVNEFRQAHVLQQLKLGQPMLDSEILTSYED